MIFLAVDSFPLIIVSVTLIILFGLGIKFVPKNKVYIVERLGVYHRTLKRGIYFIFIGSERIRAKVSLLEQQEIFQIEVFDKKFQSIRSQVEVFYVIKTPNNYAYRSSVILEDLRKYIFNYFEDKLYDDSMNQDQIDSTILLNYLNKIEDLQDLTFTQIKLTIKK